jgi:DNA processing protein
MNNDLIYRIAISLVPGIGDVHARALINHFGDARTVFNSPAKKLEKLEGIGKQRASAISKFRDFKRCESEIRFIENHSIQPLFFLDPGFPKRLLQAYDCPVMLYHLGNADLNHPRIISVVGTRNSDEYGKTLCEKLIADLAAMDVMIMSGLAYGIDSIAHRKALTEGLPTVAALAHGLDRIYPWKNKSMAAQMVRQGGLVTDFLSGTSPDKQNFPRRNRIVAGMCDGLVVIQSGEKGGSLITADLANGYDREVFAYPGAVDNPKSRGCHDLVMQHKAALITCARELTERMGWTDANSRKQVEQTFLFPPLTEEERMVLRAIQEQICDIDSLKYRTGLNQGKLAAALLNLEMQSLVKTLPGKKFMPERGLPAV